MLIESDVKLNFSDVMIRPKRTSLDSRSQVKLVKQFLPKYGHQFSGVPIIAANMATGTFEMLDVFSKHQMFVAIAKFESDKWLHKLDNDGILGDFHNYMTYGFYTIGMSNDELLKFNEFYVKVEQSGYVADNIKLCVDIANGYSQKFAGFISKIRDRYPNIVITAGNVVTPDMTQELILGGADYVKIGIGQGCLAGDTRVLMSNGTYKDIKNIRLHDRVINGHGMPVEVIGTTYSGLRKVKKYKNNLFYKKTIVTSDHKHMVGDYGSFAASADQCNLQEKLHKLTRLGDSKFHWDNLEDNLKNKTLVMPMKVSFELAETFQVNMDDFAHTIRGFGGSSELNKLIEPSYELGYLIGAFIGDGTAALYKTSRTSKSGQISRNTSGALKWFYGRHETDIAAKTINALKTVFNANAIDVTPESKNIIEVTCKSNVMSRFFMQFYDGKIKTIPEKYLINNKPYLTGILDGMVDSDGSYLADGRVRFGNTSPELIERFSIIYYLIHGYFISMQEREPTVGGLVGVNIENCKPSYLCSSVNNHQSDDYKYQINRVYNTPEDVDILVPTYDIEVDCESHSFIANNSVVHNSKCSTRLKTAVGYPQLSAIIECADAAHGLDAGIIADGGIRSAGDFGRAFCANADMAMAGGIFAGTDECHGNVISRYYKTGEVELRYEDADRLGNPTPIYKDVITTKKFKLFYGMSSEYAQKTHLGEMKNYRTSEGLIEEVPYVGSVEAIVNDILGGLRSTGTYVGADDIKKFGKCATFIRTNQVHDKF